MGLNLISFFTFLKPKTFEYCLFPQTVKDKSVTVEKDANSEMFIGNDGNKYVQKQIVCKKKVKLSNGTTYSNGDTEFFKVEPIVWEVGSTDEDKKKNCISKYILTVRGKGKSELLIEKEESDKYGKENVYAPGYVATLRASYNWQGKATDCPTRNVIKKCTDYAIASGVTVKGKKGYHTFMESNAMALTPNGKLVEVGGKITTGELLFFSCDKAKVKQMIEDTKQKEAERKVAKQ